MLDIEHERPEHHEAIHRLLCAAFPTAEEAELVGALRAAEALSSSLVASDAGVILGYLAFSPVTIQPSLPFVVAQGLGPLAVAPHAQRLGIGSALVRAGLRECQEKGWNAVVVLGDPSYYGRFGFRPAAERGLRCVFDVPAQYFMMLALQPGAVPFHQGVVHYHSAFDRFISTGDKERSG